MKQALTPVKYWYRLLDLSEGADSMMSHVSPSAPHHSSSSSSRCVHSTDPWSLLHPLHSQRSHQLPPERRSLQKQCRDPADRPRAAVRGGQRHGVQRRRPAAGGRRPAEDGAVAQHADLGQQQPPQHLQRLPAVPHVRTNTWTDSDIHLHVTVE